MLKSKGVPVVWVGLPAVRGTEGEHRTCCSWIRCIAMPPARPASPMSMSGMASSTKPAAFCSRARISKARSAGCVPMTACISPRPAPASSRIMSSARSRGCWRRAPRRSRCRPNLRRPMPMRSPASRRRVRWRDRSCRWWHPPSAPINCSAARDRARPRSTRSRRERWSRASRWRRPPAAPMISSGRAARSDANRPRAKRRWPPLHPMERCAPAAAAPSRAAEAEEDRGRFNPAPPLRRILRIWQRAAPAAAGRSRKAAAPRPPGNVGRSASAPGFLHALDRHRVSDRASV